MDTELYNKENGSSAKQVETKKQQEEVVVKKQVLGNNGQVKVEEGCDLDDMLFNRKVENQKKVQESEPFTLKLYPCF